MLLLTALPASIAVSEKDNTISSTGTLLIPALYYDELDQNQSVYVENVFLPIGRMPIGGSVLMVEVAQSFIPTREVLTRVELYAGRNSTASNPLVVGIRDNLTHENLVETSVPPWDFVAGNFSWVNCDFDDLWVTPGLTYYIVTSTKNVTDNWYGWAANDNADSYPNGCAWFSVDNGTSWNQSAAQNQEEPNIFNSQQLTPLGRYDDTGDMCFKTYGLHDTTLSVTTGGTFLKPAFLIQNAGSTTAVDVHWQMTITGRILHMINETTNGIQSALPPDATMQVNISSLFGLAPLSITITTSAVNAQKVSVTKNALLLLIFIFWK